MKQISILLTLIILSGSRLISQEFEGIMEFRVNDNGKISNSVWYVHGDQVRIDEVEDVTRKLTKTILVNTKERTFLMLDHRDSTWDTLKTFGALRTENFTTDDLPGTRDILGLRCLQRGISSPLDTMRFNVWMASGKFSFFRKTMILIGPYYPCWSYLPLIDPRGHHIPMQMIRQDLKGKETGSWEVVRFERRPISEDMFRIPADFRKADSR